ncbi:MAG: polyprenol monophosphomannose synthase, partial [Elusimicrobiales bacterium]|nr:polyprenol monophosphomannose synthase [Elusimicrobiales bacterium]
NTMKIFVIIATFNEIANIERLLKKVLEITLPIEIVVIDDNSPDGTGKLVDKLKENEKRLHIVHREKKLGLGTAHIAGFKYSMEKNADLILTMDADFSHDPSYIPAIIEQSKNFDIIIGSRYVDGGKALNSPLSRKLLSRCANLFAKTMIGLKARDCTAGFRCYKTAIFKSINLDEVFSNGYSFLIEILYKLQNHGFSVKEIPITFTDRELGMSKISKNEIIKAIETVIKLTWKR